MKKLFPAAAIALSLIVATAPAHAAPGKGKGKGKPVAASPPTSTAPTSTSDTSSELDCAAASFSFTGCSGSYTLGNGQNDVTNGGANNLATQQLNDENLFGETDWSFGAKYESNTSGANNEGFRIDGLGSTSGTFGFSELDLTTTDLAVSLKSAKGYSLYYFEAGSITDANEIAWDTAGTSTNGNGTAQGLSHFSYYTRISAITPEVEKRLKKVPEPTAMAGLLAVGMAAALRKKRNLKG